MKKKKKKKKRRKRKGKIYILEVQKLTLNGEHILKNNNERSLFEQNKERTNRNNSQKTKHFKL